MLSWAIVDGLLRHFDAPEPLTERGLWLSDAMGWSFKFSTFQLSLRNDSGLCSGRFSHPFFWHSPGHISAYHYRPNTARLSVVID